MQINPDIFLNRELSWLAFNSRVLDQSRKEIPLLERLKFIAIYATNLDEFYMIRVAGLKQLYLASISLIGPDEMRPAQQLFLIREYLHKELKEVEEEFSKIKSALWLEDLHICEYKELDKAQEALCDEYFASYIFSLLIPIAIDATHPFPYLTNLSSSIVIKLSDLENEDSCKFAMIKIPAILPKFYKLGNYFISIESIIKAHIKDIFPGYKELASSTFRVTRNADMVIAREEADDFMILLEQGLRLRRKGVFVRLQIEKNCDLAIIDFLHTHLKIDDTDTFKYDNLIDFSALLELVNDKDLSHFLFPSYKPKSLYKENRDIFSLLDKNDILIYQPFESFELVSSFIEEACYDLEVISIRMSLYRVERSSSIVNALIEAANLGKQVTVMVELRARFDEENNLAWAKSLEKAGAHVIYGITGFKTHAKLAQIIKQKKGKLQIYNHISTGNYNANSAKIYTDVSYFTKKEDISKDTTTFFHILSGFSKNQSLKTLAMSPNQIKDELLLMIKNEKKAKKGHIIAKMNALIDPDIILALYEASNAGTKIELIIRGACCLKPGLKNYSENISVRSIIGKYLEHARIFYFKNTSPNYFISSADWMGRNLKSRLELMCPIYDEALRQKLDLILKYQLKDNMLAYSLESDGVYIKEEAKDKPFDSQKELENYTSGLYKKMLKEKN